MSSMPELFMGALLSMSRYEVIYRVMYDVYPEDAGDDEGYSYEGGLAVFNIWQVGLLNLYEPEYAIYYEHVDLYVQ